jgi:hypothetical protein
MLRPNFSPVPDIVITNISFTNLSCVPNALRGKQLHYPVDEVDSINALYCIMRIEKPYALSNINFIAVAPFKKNLSAREICSRRLLTIVTG